MSAFLPPLPETYHFHRKEKVSDLIKAVQNNNLGAIQYCVETGHCVNANNHKALRIAFEKSSESNEKEKDKTAWFLLSYYFNDTKKYKLSLYKPSSNKSLKKKIKLLIWNRNKNLKKKIQELQDRRIKEIVDKILLISGYCQTPSDIPSHIPPDITKIVVKYTGEPLVPYYSNEKNNLLVAYRAVEIYDPKKTIAKKIKRCFPIQY